MPWISPSAPMATAVHLGRAGQRREHDVARLRDRPRRVLPRRAAVEVGRRGLPPDVVDASVCPAAWMFDAMLPPMMPSPMNPTFIPSLLSSAWRSHVPTARILSRGAERVQRAAGLSCRGVHLSGARRRRARPVDRRRLDLGHAGHRLRPVLLVPRLLRRAPRGVRLVSRRHRAGLFHLVDRPGVVLAGGRDAGRPRGAAPRDAGGRGRPGRSVSPLERRRLAVVALSRHGRSRRRRRVRGELGAERGADRGVVCPPPGQHDGARVLRHGRRRPGDGTARPVAHRRPRLAHGVPRAGRGDARRAGAARVARFRDAPPLRGRSGPGASGPTSIGPAGRQHGGRRAPDARVLGALRRLPLHAARSVPHRHAPGGVRRRPRLSEDVRGRHLRPHRSPVHRGQDRLRRRRRPLRPRVVGHDLVRLHGGGHALPLEPRGVAGRRWPSTRTRSCSGWASARAARSSPRWRLSSFPGGGSASSMAC